MSLSDPITVSQSFDLPKEVVWSAITEHDQLVQWFFDKIPEFRAEVGFETSFLIDLGERQFTHLWKIIDVIPNQKIVYSWRYAEYPEGDGLVSFDLSGDKESTNLTVTASGTETFPQDIPEFKRESGVEGWTYFIQESLKNYLNQ